MTFTSFNQQIGPDDIFLFDLDSTLCHTLHRAHLAPPPVGDNPANTWVDYSMACYDDPPIEGAVRTVQLLSLMLPGYGISGRSIDAYQNTVAWLDQYEVPFESLRLRQPTDTDHNGDYKVNHALQLKREGLNPILMLEDWPDVADQIEAIGIPVLCVNPRYNDSVMRKYADLYTAPALETP